MINRSHNGHDGYLCLYGNECGKTRSMNSIFITKRANWFGDGRLKFSDE